MPIPFTDAHRKDMIEQAARGVLNLQKSVRRNAQDHKNLAVAESIPLVELQTRITNMLAAYERVRSKLRRFRDVTIKADPKFLTVGASLNLDVISVNTIGQGVADVIDAFALMPRTSYAEIITACDYIIANVDLYPSIWDD